MSSLSRADWALVLLFAVPAIVIPGGLDRFVFGKLVIATLGVALAFMVPACGQLTRTVRILLGAGVGLLVLSAALSASPSTAFFGRAPLSEGTLVLAVYLLAGLSGGRLLGPGRSQRSMRVAIAAMAICAIAIAALAVLESFGLRPLSSDLSRPGSLLGNASDEGALGVLYTGPLLAYAIQNRRPLAVGGAVAAMITVVLSASRGALLGLLVVLLVIAVASSRKVRWTAAGTLLGVGVLALVVPFTRDRIFGLTPLAAHTVSGRGLLWRESLALLGKHPLLGVGASQFENAIVAEHNLEWNTTVGPANPPGSPHNWILQSALAGGPLLLLVVLGLGTVLLRNAVRQIRTGDQVWSVGLLAGLSGYATALLFHFTAPSTTIPAAVLAGSLLAVAPVTARTTQAWIRGSVAGAALVLAACFLLSSLAEVWLRLGDVAVARGSLAQANADYNTARMLRPWDPDLPGQVLYQYVASATAGNTAAIPYGTQWSARVGPIADDEQIRQNRAALLLAAGDYSGAGRLLDPALALDPANPMMLLLRGVISAHLNDYAAAQKYLKSAAQINPSDPQPWQDLVIVYNDQGQTQLAQQAQATATKLQAAEH